MKNQTRREFIEFLGYSTLALGTLSLSGCVKNSISRPFPFLKRGIAEDKLTLVRGLDYSILLSWNDPISSKDRFGYNNDYIAFFPDDKSNPTSGTMWINNEYMTEIFVSGFSRKNDKVKTKEQVDKEMYSVGGSVIRVQKNEKGVWNLIQDDQHNFRITGHTMIPFTHPILGAKEGMGTLSNCAGGFTPWGTALSCEENFQDHYGYRKHGKKELEEPDWDYQWTKYYNNPSEHYGWVVEIDVKKKTAKKLIALGRFSHESATVVQAKDGRCVVYSGDDQNNEFIYKFISKNVGSLDEGTLYAANTEKGVWLPLDLKLSPALKKKFKTQTDVLIWAREAATMLGATPQDRPEDVEINPNNGEILVALSNNITKLNAFGSILRIKEKNGDYLSTEFESSTFMAGGNSTGFACPDNMAFDPAGNLWFTTDMSGSKMNKFPYSGFGNNGLFVVPQFGKDAGKAIQMASAPNDAEFTGPCFTPDGKALFLSVQHPGEQTKSLDKLTSNWPLGGNEIPKPSVVAISGPTLEMLTRR